MSAGAASAAEIELYIGQSGSGKGLSIRQRLAELRPDRLLIWDPQNEYGEYAQDGGTLAQLCKTVCATYKNKSPFKLRYIPQGKSPMPAEFAVLCDLIYHSGQILFLAEELPDVTRASWPSPQWKRLVNQGRHRKIHILGAAQRAALIDKTILANTTRLRVGSLAEARDRKSMAEALDLPVCDLDALRIQRADGWARMLMMERKDRGEVCSLVQMTVNPSGNTQEKRREIVTLRLRKDLATHVSIGFDSGTFPPTNTRKKSRK